MAGGGHFQGVPHTPGVHFQPDLRALVAKLGRLRGTFASGQVEMRKAMEAMAAEVAEFQAEDLTSAIGAHGRAQGDREHERLALVWTQPGNRLADADGFVVGLDSFLAGKPAHFYFRGLEYGSTRFVGRQFRGFFRSLEGDRYGPMAERYKQDPRLIQTVSTVQNKGTVSLSTLVSPTGRLRVNLSDNRNTDNRERLLEFPNTGRATIGTTHNGRGQIIPNTKRIGAGTRTAQSTRGGSLITIRRPIQPYHFIANGGERWMRSGRAQQHLETALKAFEGFLEFKNANGLTSRQARRATR
jgi:hypothetical protein